MIINKALGNTNTQVYRAIFITKPITELLSQAYSTKEELEDALINTTKKTTLDARIMHFIMPIQEINKTQFHLNNIIRIYKQMMKKSQH